MAISIEGISHHIVAGRNDATVVNKGYPEFTPGQEFQGDIAAGMQTDAGYLEYTVNGCLTLYHGATMADLLQVVKTQPPPKPWAGYFTSIITLDLI